MHSPKSLPEKGKKLPRINRCNVGAVKKAARRLSLMYDTVLAPTGLKSTQHPTPAQKHGLVVQGFSQETRRCVEDW
jgi:hypothetical protein